MRIFESRLLALPLLPLAGLYGSAIVAREVLYRLGLRKQVRVDAFVISIGNVTVGGSGKTPLTAWLARELASRGVRPGIVSRGYGRKSKGLVVVSDGSQILVDARQSGDEPRLLAEKAPAVPVLVDADRVRGCREAVQRFGCQILLLDDAFQHRRLYRDLDVVLVNARFGFGNGYLLPAGPLREPLSALRRAHQIVFTQCNNRKDVTVLERVVHRHTTAPCTCAAYRPSRLRSLDGNRLPLEKLNAFPVFAVAGIAQPRSFFDTLRTLGADLRGTRAYVDHHWYTIADVRRVETLARQSGAKAILVTEKDLVRLKPLAGSLTLPWLALEVELMRVSPDEEFWDAFLTNLAERVRGANSTSRPSSHQH